MIDLRMPDKLIVRLEEDDRAAKTKGAKKSAS